MEINGTVTVQNKVPASLIKSENTVSDKFEKTSSVVIAPKDKLDKGNYKIQTAVWEAVKIKGASFAAQYTIAGAAVGLGFKYKFLNFLPQVVKNTPVMLKVSGTLPRAIATATVAGAVGIGLGAAKGAADGLIVGYSPNKAVAMTGVAFTTGLATVPVLKINKPVGIFAIAASTALGAYYGSHLYDKSGK